MDIGKAASDALSGALGGMSLGPFGMIAGALISAVPDLIGAFAPHLAGAQSEQVAQAVVQVVSAATGVAQPQPADISNLTPEAKTNLQVQLAQIAMQAEANRLADEKSARDTQMAELQASLLDTQSARSQTLALAQARSPLEYGSVVVSILVILAFGFVLWATFVLQVAPAQVAMLHDLTETLKVLTVAVVQFWVGSSRSSQTKDATIANSIPASALGNQQQSAAPAPASGAAGAKPPFPAAGARK